MQLSFKNAGDRRGCYGEEDRRTRQESLEGDQVSQNILLGFQLCFVDSVFMFDKMKTFDSALFLRAEFGQCVFHDNGELNRAALRTIIFEVNI